MKQKYNKKGTLDTIIFRSARSENRVLNILDAVYTHTRPPTSAECVMSALSSKEDKKKNIYINTYTPYFVEKHSNLT